eukprot:TRINITY_DN876_c0_g1_i1.p1 TRINITY_DN876_c0_g1~~TRINITY_DN876_c0_g1_i1.p1  ORF type:complete len:237 (+),score=46.52 TRINITY_DN876_c0_g1_i1:28-711(+)
MLRSLCTRTVPRSHPSWSFSRTALATNAFSGRRWSSSDDFIDKPSAGEGDKLQAEIAEKQQRFNALRKEMLYVMAENDNLRKATAEKVRLTKEEGHHDFALDLLDVADALAEAVQRFPAGVGDKQHKLHPFCEGVGMTANQLTKVFAKHGIQQLPVTVGETVVQEGRHEVVDTERAAEGVKSGTVLRVVRPGWSLRDTVLRPAQVVVASAGPQENRMEAEGGTTIPQ